MEVTYYGPPPNQAAQHYGLPPHHANHSPIDPLPPYSDQDLSGPYPQHKHTGPYHQGQWQSSYPQVPNTQGHVLNALTGPTQLSREPPTSRGSFSHSSKSQASSTTAQNSKNQFVQSSHVPASAGSVAHVKQEYLPSSHVRPSSVASSRKASTDQSVSMRTVSEADDDDDDDDDDVLRLLDLPDLPISTDYSKPRLVEKPVRAVDASGSDLGSPVHEVPAEGKAFIISKYFETSTVDHLLVNVFYTAEFIERKSDPIFEMIRTESIGASAQKPNGSQSSESEKPLNAACTRTNTPHDTNPSPEDAGNETPLYRQDHGTSPRIRDALDPDVDDCYQDDSKMVRYPFQQRGQLPGLGAVPQPPPPPPPSNRKASLPTNGIGSRLSPGQMGARNSGYCPNGRGRNTSSNGRQVSPGAYSSNRKRRLEATDFMESPEHERKRQDDDYIPKHKRNQPKVAEAYSRRW
ncbi:MAG: hypothetical protein LQ340_003046 [Diploschistes diacapsis]|nr:MAG: hypothetical protein LQ340_003046 [Diploschistes diacapsis]